MGEEREEGMRFRSTVRLGPNLTPRERRLLFNAARTCEVHRMLRRSVEFGETLLHEVKRDARCQSVQGVMHKLT